MADTTTTRRRQAAQVEDQRAAQAAAVDPDDEEEDDELDPTPTPGGASLDDYDDEDDTPLEDDDDDDDIVVGEGWDEAEAPSGDYPIVDRGPYRALLSDVEVRTAGPKAGNPGSKYAVLVWKIRAEDNPESMEENAPTVTIWKSLFFTPKSYGRTKKEVEPMGVRVRAGQSIIEPLRELADDETVFDVIVGIERVKREDPETGRQRSVQQNKILRVVGPAD